jgi:hypothetical protein
MSPTYPRANNDVLESTKQQIEETSKRVTGAGALHWATLAAIGASITLFLAGKRDWAIFIGLWPPTFQALRHREDR